MAERFARTGEGRSMTVDVSGTRIPGSARVPERPPTPQPADRRETERRRQRHRERAVASWLRDLSR